MDTQGERIRKIRKTRKLTQKELARRAGIEEALMRRYEYGDRNPKDGQLEKIAAALEVRLSNLRVRTEAMHELLPTLLYELLADFGDFEIVNHGENLAISVKRAGLGYQWNEYLRVIQKKKTELPADEFANWLLTSSPATIFLELAHEKAHAPLDVEV